MKKYEVSEKLGRLKPIIEQTIKPTIEINFKKMKCELWDSKVGGEPYLEIGM